MQKILKNKNSVVLVMGLLFVTKILGFLKLRTIAQIFGASHELDIFWAAFTIPDTIFMVLVAGSINAAIIPIFSEVLYGQGKKQLNEFFNKLLIVLSLSFIVICSLVFVFTPEITNFIINSEILQQYLNFGERLNGSDIDLFIKLTRIMLISPLILGVSNLVTAFLQVKKQFFVTSLAPLFYNLAMMIGPIIFVSVLDMGVQGVAISAVAGSVLHLLVQLPALFRYHDESLRFGFKSIVGAFKDTHVWKTLKLAVPRTIGILGEQVNVVVNTLISFSLAEGALSAYKFAFSLHLFPINIVGSAIAQVSLPDLAKCNETKDIKKFKDVFNKAIQYSLYLVFPIVAVLIVLRLPLVRLAYGTGAFDWRATILTAWSLSLLGFSIIGQTVVQIVLRAFYALKETKLPLIGIFIGILVNIAGAYYLTNFFTHYYDWRPIVEQIWFQVSSANTEGLTDVLKSFFTDTWRWCNERGDSDMGVGGLALSMSLSYMVEMVVLSILLNRRQKLVTWRETIKPALLKVLNTLLMIAGMYFVFKLFDFQLDTTRTIYIIILTVITSLYGLVSYLLGSMVFKIKEYEFVKDNLRALVKRVTKK